MAPSNTEGPLESDFATLWARISISAESQTPKSYTHHLKIRRCHHMVSNLGPWRKSQIPYPLSYLTPPPARSVWAMCLRHLIELGGDGGGDGGDGGGDGGDGDGASRHLSSLGFDPWTLGARV